MHLSLLKGSHIKRTRPPRPELGCGSRAEIKAERCGFQECTCNPLLLLWADPGWVGIAVVGAGGYFCRTFRRPCQRRFLHLFPLYCFFETAALASALCSKEVLTLGPVLGSSSVTYSACLRFSRALCYTARSFPPALRCIYHLQLIRAPRDLSAFLRFSIPSYTTRRSRRRPCLLIPPRIIDLPKTTTPYIYPGLCMWSASNTAFATCSGLLFLKSFKYLASLQHSKRRRGE